MVIPLWYRQNQLSDYINIEEIRALDQVLADVGLTASDERASQRKTSAKCLYCPPSALSELLGDRHDVGKCLFWRN